MDFRQLRSFASVVEQGSFTRAAEKLSISQPTISMHIRALEEELGTRLVLRTTKNLEITPKGRAVYDYAARILELRSRMIQCCAMEAGQIIHLGASTIPAAYILPELLPRYSQSAPDTYFVIHQDTGSAVLKGLEEGLFDIGLTSACREEGDLQFVPLRRDRMVLITPVNEKFLTLQQEGGDPLEILRKEPVILREKGSRKDADRFLEKMGLEEEKLNVSARVNDQEAVKNLVAGGLGVSILSEIAARNFLKERRLLKFELPEQGEGKRLYLVYRKSSPLTGPIRDFAAFLEQSVD